VMLSSAGDHSGIRVDLFTPIPRLPPSSGNASRSRGKEPAVGPELLDRDSVGSSVSRLLSGGYVCSGHAERSSIPSPGRSRFPGSHCALIYSFPLRDGGRLGRG